MEKDVENELLHSIVKACQSLIQINWAKEQNKRFDD